VYNNKRIVAIILARKGSSRLKNKMLLPFGKSTVIETVIERIQESELIDSFILATSINPDDDVFRDIASKHAIDFVRGSEEDVVSRMVKAVYQGPVLPDIIVRVCSDNPLLMPSIVDEAIKLLVDYDGDVVTPFEHNTYPFGYSMVIMTRGCLEKIDQKAKEKLYREHVENFCFETSEDFRIFYQCAPEPLHFSELNLTMDYEVDYIRLKRFHSILTQIPMKMQPKKLIQFIKNCKVGLLIQEEESIPKLAKFVVKNCYYPPVCLCLSKNGKNAKRTINVIHGGATAKVQLYYRNDFEVLLEDIKKTYMDLVISSVAIPDTSGIRPSRGIVFVDTFDIKDEKRHCLRCRYFDNWEPSSVREETIFIDFKDNSSVESSDAFLCRILPYTIRHLMAGPLRPYDKQESFYPREEKRGLRKRKGFSSVASLRFPPFVLTELVEEKKNRRDSKVLYLERFLVNKLLDEICKYDFDFIVVGVKNDPRKHPDFHWILDKLKGSVGGGKVVLWPEVKSFTNKTLEESVFQQIVIRPKSRIEVWAPNEAEEVLIGNYSDISIAEAWQSKKMQRVRASCLNPWLI